MSSNHSRPVLRLIAVLLTLCSAAGAAQASTRTWVSGAGSDANPCTRSAPCLTFAHTLSQTTAGGEIDVLDSGDFGAVTITQAVSIVANGTLATIQVTSGNAITVNAGANDIVVLKGLSLDGEGTANDGINFTAGGTLHVESCTINRFANIGIDIAPPSTNGKVFIKDSIVRDNGIGSTGGGIYFNPTFGQGNSVIASVDATRMENNIVGLKAFGLSSVVVRNSISTQNAFSGFSAVQTGPTMNLFLENSESSYNGTNGITCSGALSPQHPIIHITNMVITGNATGMAIANNCEIISFSNNKNDGNTTNGSPTSTVSQQ
jgi:hypothetical protein